MDRWKAHGAFSKIKASMVYCIWFTNYNEIGETFRAFWPEMTKWRSWIFLGDTWMLLMQFYITDKFQGILNWGSMNCNIALLHNVSPSHFLSFLYCCLSSKGIQHEQLLHKKKNPLRRPFTTAAQVLCSVFCMFKEKCIGRLHATFQSVKESLLWVGVKLWTTLFVFDKQIF